ncbi:MAG: hypothetical protein RLZZ200_3035 [Pseudomonadota bacterium]|jgi:cell wall-associated NlpC family hydrolase
MKRFAPLLVLLGLVGCAASPRMPGTAGDEVESPGARIASLAAGQLGQPYRFGGDGSGGGFDCSGLALFVHQQLGISLPRTAREQRAQSGALDRSELQQGDLVFFTMGPKLLVDHVGIYVGDGRFIHAPRAGSPVRLAQLDASPFARQFAGGARYWAARTVQPVTVSEGPDLTPHSR